MLHISRNLETKCHNSTLLLDTNVFIHASANPQLLKYLAELADMKNTILATISSVVFEYTRGVRSLAELEARREFIYGLTERVIPIGRYFETDKNDVFSTVMSLVLKKSDSQYTDFLLATALYQYRNAPETIFVLSSDVRAFPGALFDVEGVITTGGTSDQSLAHLCLVTLNAENYASVAAKLQSK